MALHEFDLIERYFRAESAGQPQVLCGIGDDCAMLQLPPGESLLVSVDTLVESVHFPKDILPDQLARRALAVCVSDLAASGAMPLGFTLALTLPKINEAWLAAFSAALGEAAREYAIPLVGGDTTRGPLGLSLQVMGSAPASQALLRSGANIGDDIYVSGQLGAARAALVFLDKRGRLSKAEKACLHAYYQPQPQLALGIALRGVASAAIDISDGLAADLEHILKASGVGAQINTADLPIAAPVLKLYAEQAVDFALGGGDDYQLCFTAPVSARDSLQSIAAKLDVSLTCIGVVEAAPGLRCADNNGQQIISPAGYRHF
ncbi:MAG: thiamine-phosphate kinase [Spongiibacteraceae bacterium]